MRISSYAQDANLYLRRLNCDRPAGLTKFFPTHWRHFFFFCWYVFYHGCFLTLFLSTVYNIFRPLCGWKICVEKNKTDATTTVQCSNVVALVKLEYCFFLFLSFLPKTYFSFSSFSSNIIDFDLPLQGTDDSFREFALAFGGCFTKILFRRWNIFCHAMNANSFEPPVKPRRIAFKRIFNTYFANSFDREIWES